MLKLVRDNLDKVETMLRSRSLAPEIQIKTLTELNKKLWGLHRKKLTIIAARTSNGKSALAGQFAWDVAEQGFNVLFLSLEMYEEDVIERMFCQVMKVDNMDLLTGKFKEHTDKWEEFQKRLANVKLVVTDMLGRDWPAVYDQIDKMSIKPDVVIIDHVQEARDAGLNNQKQVIEEYLKKLRIMAIQFNFAAIVLSQVNRASQEDDHREPQLHHLKGTGYLEEGADVILLLHWPYYYSKKRGENNRFIISVAKNRNGRTGWIPVSYQPQFYLFEDYKSKDEPAAEPVDTSKAAAGEVQEAIDWQD